jgi:signal transduction histidine kinase
VVGYFQDLYAALAEERKPPDTFRGELEYSCSDGSTVWTEAQVTPRYAPDGSLVEILGVSRDISQARAQRAAINEAEIEMERQRTLAEERERMARDLHDDLLQALSAANLEIGAAEYRAGDPDGMREALNRSREDLQTAIESARRLVTGLRAQQLEGRGLADALRTLVDEFTARTGIEAPFDGGDVGELDRAVEECLFRVAQEGLTNVAKHAGARKVLVRLERSADDVTVTVVDDGRGGVGDDAMSAGGFGLIGMRERADAVGGALSVESGASGGTSVHVRVPVLA